MTRREFGPWAVTAAGIGVVLCLVVWPYTTLCAGAAVVAAVVLALGVRGLIRGPKTRTAPEEQQASPGDRAICGACGFDPYAEKKHRPWCAVFSQPAAPATRTRRHALVFNAITRVLSDADDHVRLSVRDTAAWAVLNALDTDRPDPSGQDPETARTDPDAPGQQPADQAGPDPDQGGRVRIAVADWVLPMIAEINSGPGWYEVISPRATTCIAYVHEGGSLYLPEGEDALSPTEFAYAAARGNIHRLVRADDHPTPDQVISAEAAVTRARERCQQVRDRVGPGGMINASQILGLLSPRHV